jgi:hypothetical protein
MMNVIVGIFCQCAMEAYEQDKDHMVETALNERKMYVSALSDLFTRWDIAGDGIITKRDFEQHLSDPNMRALLKKLDIERRDALTLFGLLDQNGTEGIDIDEFICGCIMYKGGAKAIQVEKSQVELKEVAKGFQRLERAHSQTANDVHRLCDMCRDLTDTRARSPDNRSPRAGLGKFGTYLNLPQSAISHPHLPTEFEEC